MRWFEATLRCVIAHKTEELSCTAAEAYYHANIYCF